MELIIFSFVETSSISLIIEYRLLIPDELLTKIKLLTFIIIYKENLYLEKKNPRLNDH